eukprot:scaffold57258_cov28-Prasinocladus_malaysianus.AAC.1
MDFMSQQQNAIRDVEVVMPCEVHMNTCKHENVVWNSGCYHIINRVLENAYERDILQQQSKPEC